MDRQRPADWRAKRLPRLSRSLPSGADSVDAADTARMQVLPAASTADAATARMPAAPLPAQWWDATAERIPLGLRTLLADGFPPRLTLAVTGATAATLLVSFALAVGLLGQDWATGVLALSIASLVLSSVIALLWLVRVLLGRRALSTALLAAATVTALLGTGFTGVRVLPTIHRHEGLHLEAIGHWQAAVNEYTLAGERAPDALDVARTYDEWGEQLFARHDYAGASVQFQLAVTLFNSGGTSFARGEADLYATYAAWLKQPNAQNIQYADIIPFLASYRSNSACGATCRQESQALEAQARYNYGVQLNGFGLYDQATAQLEAVQQQFHDSPYAAKAHTLAAQAYAALGAQQLKQGSCKAALPTMQTLATGYKDTPQGVAAAAQLAAPVTVTGVLEGYPANPLPVLYLSLTAQPQYYWYSDNFRATLDATSGSFTFSNVAQGDYLLNAKRGTSASVEYSLYKDNKSGDWLAVHVGPLCPVSIGTVPYQGGQIQAGA